MIFRSLKSILFLIVSGIFLNTSLVYSQNKRLDSLILLSKKIKDTSLIKILNEISWEYKSSDIDSAFYYANSALTKANSLANRKLIAASYNSIANIYEADSKLDSANHYLRKSLTIKKEIKDSLGIADTYNNLGIIEDLQGNYLKALEHYFNALSIYEKKSSSFDKVPAVLVNIGIVYKKQERFDKVLTYYNRALEIYKENNFDVGIVIITGNIGGVHLKLGNYKETISYCVEAKKGYANLGYNKYVPYMDVNIANAEYHLKRYNDAIARYKKTIQAFVEQDNKYELANAKIGIAKPLIANRNFNDANTQLLEALAITEENNFKEFEADALKQLSQLNFSTKNFKQAYEYQAKFYERKDSLFAQNKVKDINELLTKYETEKKEKEIAVQKEELLAKELALKNRNLYVIIITSIFLILGIIFFAVYKKNQFKRKQLQKEIDLKDALATIKTQNRLQEQRLKISRDLHDNIGSQLTFIISSIDNLKYVSKDINDKLKEKLNTISSFTGDTIHQLRDTIWAMNKSEITVEDLHTRVLSFVEKAKLAVPEIKFDVSYDIDKNQSFNSLTGMNIFRVLQEAINNAIKYANANEVTIELFKVKDSFKAKVTDNGVGFNIKDVNLGNGLSNMEKRMNEIGGKVFIDSKENKGTSITLETNIKNTTNDV